MTVVLRTADGFADRLLADARDGLAQYRAMVGPLTGPVLDIGAHYGSFALMAAEAGASEVLAVEAAHENFLALRDNIAASERVDVVVGVFGAALETDDRVVTLRKAASGNSGQHSVVFHAGHPVSDDEVPVLKLSHLLALRSWAIVKIDIEGGEWSLLRHREGAVEVLMRHTQFLDIEIHPLNDRGYYPETPPDAYAYVDEVGEWFRKAGHAVVWTVQHPMRLFVAAA